MTYQSGSGRRQVSRALRAYGHRKSRRANANRTEPFWFQPGGKITLDPVVHHDNLICVWKQMQREGGQAPGPDGIQYEDVGRRELGDAMRCVSHLLVQGTYRPGPAKSVSIPKPAGGTRTLTLRNTVDRVVSKALTLAIEPLIDPQLLDCSLGFRPKRNTWQLLARLEACVVNENRWILTTDDIKQAFDHVPLEATTEAFSRHIDDPKLLGLIGTILRGHEGESREVGIDQGDPLSPLALNVLLDQVLDRPLLAACGDTPFWRYADNLVWCGQSVSEGNRVLSEARQLLNGHGFSLKGGSRPVNLRRQGARVELLGFRISRDGDVLTYGLTREAWRSFTQQLSGVHDAPYPAKTATTVLRGWLEAHGPAFGGDNGSAAVDRVLRMAAQEGFREVPSRGQLLRIVRDAHARWVSLRSGSSRDDSVGRAVPGSMSGPRSARPRTTACPS